MMPAVHEILLTVLHLAVCNWCKCYFRCCTFSLGTGKTGARSYIHEDGALGQGDLLHSYGRIAA